MPLALLLQLSASPSAYDNPAPDELSSNQSMGFPPSNSAQPIPCLDSGPTPAHSSPGTARQVSVEGNNSVAFPSWILYVCFACLTSPNSPSSQRPTSFEVRVTLFNHNDVSSLQNVNPMLGGSSTAQGRGGPQSQPPHQPSLRNQVPPPILPSQVALNTKHYLLYCHKQCDVME